MGSEIESALVGARIVKAEAHVGDPTPGFDEGDRSIEAMTLTFEDGRSLHLRAWGWHDIQSLEISLAEAEEREADHQEA